MPVRISKAALARLRTKEAKSQEELVQRMRADYQVSLAERVLKSEVQSVDVTFSATESGSWLLPIIESLWYTHLPKMLDCIAEGRVAFEKDWLYKSGKSAIVDLIPLPIEVSDLLLKDGDFAGIRVRTGEDAHDTIPPVSAWWLALDPDARYPHGKSRFQGAPYETWKERREAIRLRKLLISKFVIRGLIGRVPTTVKLENGQSVDAVSDFLQQADELMAGGAMALPNDIDPITNRPAYDIVSFPEVSDPAPLDNHIDGLDQEQLQAFGIPPKTVLEGDSGSYAMVVAQRRVLDAVVDDILTQIESSFQKYVIDKTCQANGLPAGAVTIEHEPLVSRVNQMLYDILLAIMANGDVMAKLLDGVIDIGQVLDKLRVPLKSGARKVLETLFKSMPKQEQTPQTPPVQQNT